MSSKRKAKGAASAAPTPAEDGPSFDVVLTLRLIPMPDDPQRVGVDMGLAVDGPETLGRLLMANEPALRPYIEAYRDAVLLAVGGVGSAGPCQVESSETEVYPSPRDPRVGRA